MKIFIKYFSRRFKNSYQCLYLPNNCAWRLLSLCKQALFLYKCVSRSLSKYLSIAANQRFMVKFTSEKRTTKEYTKSNPKKFICNMCVQMYKGNNPGECLSIEGSYSCLPYYPHTHNGLFQVTGFYIIIIKEHFRGLGICLCWHELGIKCCPRTVVLLRASMLSIFIDELCNRVSTMKGLFCDQLTPCLHSRVLLCTLNK